MASFLYRVGRAATRHPLVLLVGWVLVLVLAGAAALVAGGELDDAVVIPGTEAQQGLDVLDERFPEVAGTSAQLVFVAPRGERIETYRTEVDAVLDRVGAVRDVVAVRDPFAADNALGLSTDHRYAQAPVQLGSSLGEVDPATVSGLEAAVRSLPAGSPLRVGLGGSIYTQTKVTVSWVEGGGALVALLTLVLTFGSMLAAGLPMVSALVGLGVTMAGVLTVAALIPVNSTTPTLALMIGLAVGIDYALFVLSRHRAQLAGGMSVAESVARSVATAGSAVVFAGATVIIALCGLSVARIPFLTVMGVAAAVAVAVAVMVALTALPAAMTLAGERLRPRPGSRIARAARADHGRPATLGARWVGLITRVPAVTVLLVVAGLGAMAIPATDLRLALPDHGTADEGTPQRETYDLIASGFGPGYNTPLLVTADIIRTTDPVGTVRRLADDLGALDGVAGIGVATPNRSADLGIVQVVPAGGQTDPATAALVHEIRKQRPDLERRYGITDLRVTGHTAVTIDVSQRLSGALLPFGLVVVGLSLVLLLLVFRSVAVPIKATLGYLLSVAASFGAVAAVFEWGWLAGAIGVTRTGPVISFLPIVLMGVLFGLSMDYEVFLVSRMREDYVHGADARSAVVTGFTGSVRVVGAAAVIMVCVFAAFVPESTQMIKPIALGLAVGVAVDAFAVRMTLVPAVMTLLGRSAWWLPAGLGRLLPQLDVEGTALTHHLAHEEWTARHGAAAVRAENLTLRDETGGTLLQDVCLIAAPASVVVVTGADPVARHALLACVAGRLAPTSGTLVVLDRVLPAERAAVLSRAAFLTGADPAAQLCRAAAVPVPPALVVLDGLGGADAQQLLAARAGSGDPSDLSEAARALARAGTTVVAGCAEDPGPDGLHPPVPGVTVCRLPAPLAGHSSTRRPGSVEEGDPCPAVRS